MSKVGGRRRGRSDPAWKRGTAGVGPYKSYENIPDIVLMILVSAARSMPGPGRTNPLTLQHRLVLGVVLFDILPLPGVSLSQAGDGLYGTLPRKKKKSREVPPEKLHVVT